MLASLVIVGPLLVAAIAAHGRPVRHGREQRRSKIAELVITVDDAPADPKRAGLPLRLGLRIVHGVAALDAALPETTILARYMAPVILQKPMVTAIQQRCLPIVSRWNPRVARRIWING